jgi:hypothetical protein
LKKTDIYFYRYAGARCAQAGAGQGHAAVRSPTKKKTAIACMIVCVSRRLRACITPCGCPSEPPRTLTRRRLTGACCGGVCSGNGGRRRDARESRAAGRSGRQPGAERRPCADLCGSGCRQHVVGQMQQGACGGGFRQAWWRGRRCVCLLSGPVASVHSCVRLHTALGCLQHSMLLDLTCRHERLNFHMLRPWPIHPRRARWRRRPLSDAGLSWRRTTQPSRPQSR